jgi:tRNA-uridine 2-sulfurtransferase
MKHKKWELEAKKKPVRALVLFSGGLDSILAVKILGAQGIDVTALTFVSYFFDAEEAKKSVKENKLKLKIVDFSDVHFEMIKKPKYGRGAGMNPCIDCHLLMLKQGKIIAKKENFDLIATGEVLGQRPMSQNSRALELIEKKASLEGRILRPLSAQVLPETEMEKEGMVDRGKMFGISGRSRKEQIALAKKYKIKHYPNPASGCILTDKEYSKKLSELLENIKRTKSSDLALLRLGRHFWVGRNRIILGRNHEENLRLKKLAERNDILIELKDIPGPTALIRGRRSKAVLDAARDLLSKYSKNSGEDPQIKIFSV